MQNSFIKIIIILCCLQFSTTSDSAIAREWNELLLDAIRSDQARPTVHARNLYHTSAAMYDAWCIYDLSCKGVFYQLKHNTDSIESDRNEAISFAAYRILHWRFSESVGAKTTLPALDLKMQGLGFDINYTDTAEINPASIGNQIAQIIIDHGLSDGSNEANNYINQVYEPINDPLIPDLPGNPDITDPNRWQPLALDFFIGQSGVEVGEYPEFLSPEWGNVTPFALTQDDLTTFSRDGDLYQVYQDPGAPPYIGGVGSDAYKAGFEQVIEFSSYLDPADGVLIDISPVSRGNNDLGTNNGNGYDINPITNNPYLPQLVLAGDYYRVLAEFWADGPDSETPPGHWFTILNEVSDHPLFEKRMQGRGLVLNDLEWEVKSYLTMGGTMHDAAISAWSVKGWYDYIRPVSAIRYMCEQGQSSDPETDNYHPNGINLHPGYIEQITLESIQVGERHQFLAGLGNSNLGEIALKAWRGPDYINNPESDVAGVGWILCDNWWPYQRPSFVSPPFAGYVSGHSVYSRAAAEVLTALTGSAFFPGGMSGFLAPQNDFLVFEEGPSTDITLQWATYQDAADETSLSRIYGGIHPTADDIPGRFMGYDIGQKSFAHAISFFGGNGTVQAIPVNSHWVLVMLILTILILTYLKSKKTYG